MVKGRLLLLRNDEVDDDSQQQEYSIFIYTTLSAPTAPSSA